MPSSMPTEPSTNGRISDAILGKTSKRKGQLKGWPCDDPDEWWDEDDDTPYDLPGSKGHFLDSQRAYSQATATARPSKPRIAKTIKSDNLNTVSRFWVSKPDNCIYLCV